MEENMLQLAEGVTESSRLSCQITLDDSLDGLVVRLPESQH
jgi:2Fe-2S ferredoxin